MSFDSKNPPEYIDIGEGLRVGKNYLVTAQTLKIYETAEKFQGPALIVHGIADKLVPYGYGLRYRDIYKNSRIELLPNLSHDFTNNGFTKSIERTAKIVSDFFVQQLK